MSSFMWSTAAFQSSDYAHIPVNFVSQQIGPVRLLANPPLPTWACVMLIVFAVFRGLLALIAMAIMAIPAFKGPASRKRHCYLVRRVYSRQFRGMAYWVPNRSMVITLGELVSNVLYMVSACLSYRFYTSKIIPVDCHLAFWYGFAWLPSYVGIWMAGWGLAHACFCDMGSDNDKKKTWILSPKVYNFVWISWLCLVILLVTFLSFTVNSDFSELVKGVLVIIHLLKLGAVLYEIIRNTAKLPFYLVLDQRAAVFQILDRLAFRDYIFGWTWSILTIVLAFFYLVTVRYLLGLLREIMSMIRSQRIARPGGFAHAMLKELQAEFEYLSTFSLIITLSIFFQLGLWIYQLATCHRYMDAGVKLGIVIFDQLPGVLAAPTLLYQSWRIVAKLHSASESGLDCMHFLQSEFETKELPLMASQLLGWDTTENWSRPSRRSQNFPGLCQVQLEDPDHDKRFSTPMQINVLRTTETTVDTYVARAL